MTSVTPPDPKILAPEKIEVLKELTKLEQPAYTKEYPEHRASAMVNYLKKASQILIKLGKEYDELVAIRTVQGLHDADIKQTVAMIMRKTKYSFAEVEEILLPSVDKKIFQPDKNLDPRMWKA